MVLVNKKHVAPPKRSTSTKSACASNNQAFCLYVHLPFCLRKCNYCDFNSSAQYDDILVGNYVDAVINEMKIQKQNYDLQKVTSIYFGGGTPTAINYKYLAKLLNALFTTFDLSDDLEISLEANPCTNLDFSILRDMGFNRVSIGVQSFESDELNLLGRLHSADLARETIFAAKKHFENINVDIIYALPNQTAKKLLRTLEVVKEFELNHISAYSLIYENGTRITQQHQNKEFIPLTDDEDYELYMLVCEELAKNDLQQYEVSNFAKAGFECKHNLGYWQRSEYLGFGISAHSLYRDMRFSNTTDVNTYIQRLLCGETATEESEILTEQQILEEEIFLGLRSGGISLDLLGNDGNFLEELMNNGYGKIEDSRLVLTSKGKYICDEIVLRLL